MQDRLEDAAWRPRHAESGADWSKAGYLARQGSGHEIYRHPTIRGIITLPRHSDVSPGVARSIAEKAGWMDSGEATRGSMDDDTIPSLD